MLIVHVQILVKPDQVDAFKAACIENSRNSMQEPGIARFDVLQQQDDPTRFVLVEIYRSAEAPAGLLANPGEVRDYLELAGGGKPLLKRGVPFIAVPTTAGTGTEVTRNAVLDVPEHQVKASLRSPHLLARLAVVDPELTLS